MGETVLILSASIYLFVDRIVLFLDFLLDPFHRRGWVYNGKFCLIVCHHFHPIGCCGSSKVQFQTLIIIHNHPVLTGHHPGYCFWSNVSGCMRPNKVNEEVALHDSTATGFFELALSIFILLQKTNSKTTCSQPETFLNGSLVFLSVFPMWMWRYN